MKKERKEKHFINKPAYKGGPKALRAFVRQHLRYPDEARQAGVTGAVHVRYTINIKGVVTQVKIISGLGYGCDEEAVRVVKMLRFDVPQNRKGKILFHKKMAVHFRAKEKEVPKRVQVHHTPAASIQYSVKKKGVAADTKPSESKDKGYSYTINW